MYHGDSKADRNGARIFCMYDVSWHPDVYSCNKWTEFASNLSKELRLNMAEKLKGGKMGITFNGQVTINGNVEMYENHSMKFVSNEMQIPIDQLKSFIETSLSNSPKKIEYLDAADALKNSTDESILKKAIASVKSISNEVGKNVLITGLSSQVWGILNNIIASI